MAALDDVLAEREAQNEKWGEQNHNPFTWLAILTEEVGEVAKELADSTARDLDVEAYRVEMVQVAAVALQALECFDRRPLSSSGCVEGCRKRTCARSL